MDVSNSMIVTRTPVRVSFVGGGTDFAGFYRRGQGTVVSTAIDHYIYVTVKRLSPIFQEKYRLNYSESESVQRIDEIRNDIARECLRLVPVEPPLYVGTFADMPAYSGLGSSSSFAVGLLKALHAMRGERVSNGQLAEEACQVEIGMLGRPIGKQDQYAAAFGGLNCIRFHADESVSIEPLCIGHDDMQRLFNSLLLFWTGMQRDAGVVLRDQKQNLEARLDELHAMREQAERVRELLQDGIDVAELGHILDKGWQLKRRLSNAISNEGVDGWYRSARDAGALGGKLCGAGGGGFLLLVAPPERHPAIRARLCALDAVPIRYEPSGSIQIMPSGA